MLIDKIQEDLKQAQLKKDELKVSTLRMLLSGINYARIDKKGELTDSDVVSVVQKELKKRKEAAEGFRAGGREETASQEEAEAQVLMVYLPSRLTNEQLTKMVEDTITEVGAKSLADYGRVMSVVMGKAAGQADGGTVSELVKQKLQ